MEHDCVRAAGRSLGVRRRDRGRLADAKSRAIETRQTEILEVTLENGGVFEFRVLAFNGHADQMQFITTIIDRGEDRRREKVLQSLLRDVSHRSKNLLAIIQSIVTQTSQYTDSIEAYVQKLRGRIFSLSRSQDLVTDSGWRAPLRGSFWSNRSRPISRTGSS